MSKSNKIITIKSVMRQSTRIPEALEMSLKSAYTNHVKTVDQHFDVEHGEHYLKYINMQTEAFVKELDDIMASITMLKKRAEYKAMWHAEHQRTGAIEIAIMHLYHKSSLTDEEWWSLYHGRALMLLTVIKRSDIQDLVIEVDPAYAEEFVIPKKAIITILDYAQDWRDEVYKESRLHTRKSINLADIQGLLNDYDRAIEKIKIMKTRKGN